MHREIDIRRIGEYKDSISLFAEGGVAVVETKEKANGITIGWGGLGVLWSKPCCTLYIHESRYSKHMFDESDSFSVCFFGKERKKEVAYFGTASGKDEDKIANSGMALTHQEGIPYLEEAELVILCRKMGQTKFDGINVPQGRIHDWYAKDGVHSIYVGEIIKVLKKA